MAHTLTTWHAVQFLVAPNSDPEQADAEGLVLVSVDSNYEPTNPQIKMGRRSQPSHGDIEQINDMYQVHILAIVRCTPDDRVI